MDLLLIILLFTLLGSAISAGLAGVVPFVPIDSRESWTRVPIPNAMAAAFSSSISIGIATSVAVMAREVPQIVGDFANLLLDGCSRGRSFLYKLLSSMAAILGALLMNAFRAPIQVAVTYRLAVSAASVLYIALADRVPGRRDSFSLRGLVWEIQSSSRPGLGRSGCFK